MFTGIKGVVFDVGGTLYVSQALDEKVDGLAEELLASKLGVAAPEAKTMLGREREKNKQRSGDNTKVGALAAFGVERTVFHSAVADIDVMPFIKPDAALARCIDRLQDAGITIGVISNFQRKLVLKIFAALGIDHARVDQIIGEDDNLPLKPHDAPFLEMLHRLGLRAADTVFVGDSVLKDIIPARRNGMHAVLIKGTKTDGDPAEAEAVLDAASGLCALVTPKR